MTPTERSSSERSVTRDGLCGPVRSPECTGPLALGRRRSRHVWSARGRRDGAAPAARRSARDGRARGRSTVGPCSSERPVRGRSERLGARSPSPARSPARSPAPPPPSPAPRAPLGGGWKGGFSTPLRATCTVDSRRLGGGRGGVEQVGNRTIYTSRTTARSAVNPNGPHPKIRPWNPIRSRNSSTGVHGTAHGQPSTVHVVHGKPGGAIYPLSSLQKWQPRPSRPLFRHRPP